MRYIPLFLIAVTFVQLSQSYCLQASTNTTGVETGEPFSNKDEILALGPADYTFHSMTNCVNGGDELIGIQFLLKSTSGNIVELSAIGDMSGTCQTLELDDALETIKASYSLNNGAGVKSIRYIRGTIKKTYGTLLSSFVEWNFNNTVELIGLHGRMSDSTITQLGMITLDKTRISCGSTERIPNLPPDAS